MKVLKYLSFAVLLMCLASCSEENSVTLKVEAELGELANYIKLTDQEVVVNMSDEKDDDGVDCKVITSSLALEVTKSVASNYSMDFDVEVLDKNHVKIGTLPHFEIEEGYDYDNGDSQQDVDDDWEWAKGVKYCTYVNGVKDEGFYFKNENIKFKSITPEELKGDELLAELNALSDGGNQWGRITTEGDLTDYPMPVICGGSISGMKGSGSQESPYLIGSEADLRLFQQTVEQGGGVDKYYKLTADIDMSEQPMPAIGPQAHPFQGTFDGNGHSINGLVTKNGYLFHYLQGTVKNLTLLDYKGKADKTGIVTSIACFVG